MALERTRILHKLWRYLRDGGVPLWRKLVGVAAVAYIVWPFDLIPDAIPILGWLDDAGVLAAAAWFIVRDVRLHERRFPELPPSEPASPKAGTPERR